MKAQPVVIKKYGNRRLYDTSTSRYVNLDEVAALIRSGADVQVIDAATGEDRTRVTLTQIIVEDAKGGPSGLPLELLRQLILASDRARQEFLSWYLHTAFDAYQKVQEAVQTRLSDVGSAAFGPLHKMRSFLAGALTPGVGEETAPEAEVEQLRQRVAELEAKLAEKPRRRPSARPRPGPRKRSAQ